MSKIEIGATLPDFELPDENGELHRLSELQEALDIREYTDPIHDANVPHALVLSPGLKIESVYVGYWFWGRPSAYRLWDDLEGLFRRLKPDFDPTTAAAKAAWAKLEASGKVPAHH